MTSITYFFRINACQLYYRLQELSQKLLNQTNYLGKMDTFTKIVKEKFSHKIIENKINLYFEMIYITNFC